MATNAITLAQVSRVRARCSLLLASTAALPSTGAASGAVAQAPAAAGKRALTGPAVALDEVREP